MTFDTKDKFVIFLHIQKTGGITIQRVFRRKLGKSLFHRLINLGSEPEKNTAIEKMLSNKTFKDRYLIGHFCYGIDRYLPQPSTYMAFLREPVSRIISLYHYSKNNSTAYYHQHAVEKSLEDFALNTPLMELDNGQVRFIAGDPKDYFINRTPIGHCNDNLLEQAKSNLNNNFSFVGITEEFDRSLLLLKKIMKWQNCYYLRKNSAKSKSKEFVSQELKDKIARKNYLDILLYQYAKELLFDRLKQYNLDGNNELQNFQKYNFVFNQVLSSPYDVYDRAKALFRGTLERPG